MGSVRHKSLEGLALQHFFSTFAEHESEEVAFEFVDALIVYLRQRIELAELLCKLCLFGSLLELRDLPQVHIHRVERIV